MSTPSEMQEEEREVLLSIYDGDPAFKQLSATVFQYKQYGEHDDAKSFLLELQWGDGYPTDKPTVNMDTFYNRNIVECVKRRVTQLVSEEAEQLLGEAMTYSLFECLKERYEEVASQQPQLAEPSEQELAEALERACQLEAAQQQQQLLRKPATAKKEQLSKAQKRRQWDRVEGGTKGERPRGWDWVDIVKHLSQTGPKDEPPPTSSTM